MKKTTVGIVDYGVGNHASVIHCLRELGYRVRVSRDFDVLDGVDILFLPGVGAFPSAMKSLHTFRLVDYLQQQARNRRPIIGICLGMQLLASASYEFQYTSGLDLIPGEIVPVRGAKWHIGWNALECVRSDELIQTSDRQIFYFNHSFCYEGPNEYQVAITRHFEPLVAIIRRNNVVGLQFHPEKSQQVGIDLLKNIITGLVDA